MRLLVETTGPFQLIDDGGRRLIRHHGATVVVQSTFVEERCACGQLKVLAQVNEDATDEEWREYLKGASGDHDLAIAAFSSAFPLPGKEPKAVPEPEPEPEPVPVRAPAPASRRRG